MTSSQECERPVARPHDIADLDYESDLGDPGAYPYTRGTPLRAGSTGWIQRELSGEGSPSTSNQQLRYLIDQGATGLDVIGDAPTVALLDPDHPYARLSAGTQGVSLCRAQDYHDLYDGIPLDRVSMSHSLQPAFTIAGLYLAARKRGIDTRLLRGSVINAPLFMEDYAYATQLPVELRLRLALDSIEFATEHMPRFHPFLEDTYFISDGGIGPVDEIAFGLVEIREVVRRLLARGLDINRFAPRIAMVVNCRMELLTEIAKIRATRRIFARMMRHEFGATDPRAWAVNITVHTSGASMTAQQPVNNVIRGAVQALAMALANVKAMEISAFDEAYRTPSRASHMVGLRTQQIVALESDVLRSDDPLGGSYFIEALTNRLESDILDRVRQVESLGNPAGLVAGGWFRNVFQEAMVARSLAIADGSLPVVGLNCFTIPDEDDTMLREHTDSRFEPCRDHVEDIRRWRSERPIQLVERALDSVHTECGDPAVNVIPLFVDALEAGASMGEIMGAFRTAHGLTADPYEAAGALR